MDCYSAFRRKDVLTAAATRMDLEDVVPSRMSQTPKDKYRTIP